MICIPNSFLVGYAAISLAIGTGVMIRERQQVKDERLWAEILYAVLIAVGWPTFLFMALTAKLTNA